MVKIDIEVMKKKLNEKSSEELQEIWETNDRYTWNEEAFIIIKEILLERNDELLPKQSVVSEKFVQEDGLKDTPFGLLSIIFGVFVNCITIYCFNRIYFLLAIIPVLGLFVLFKGLFSELSEKKTDEKIR